MTPTPSSRQSWTASRHNTGTPSPSSTPTPETPSASMCPGSSTGNSGAPSNTTPFSISELQRALDRLKKGVVPGVDGLPAEAYQHLTLPVKRRLAARLWDIVTGATPIPPEWANLVHPLYKKGDWAQPGNWRPIVCATTEVKLVWTLVLGRIAPAVFAHVPASMWGAMAGRSPHEAIFLQDWT